MSFDFKLENGDIQLSNEKDLDIVVDNEKLLQDLLKILVTPLGGNKAHSWYGSNIGEIQVGGVFDLDFSLESSSAQARSATENLMRMQISQAQTQILSPAETITAIRDVYINTNNQDSRVLEVKVSVLTSALTVVTARFEVRL